MNSTTSSSSEIKPFTIDLEEDLLSDLQDRLAKTRMPVYPADGNWNDGTDPDYLRSSCISGSIRSIGASRRPYSTSFSHFETEIAGIDIHYLHQRGKGADSIQLTLGICRITFRSSNGLSKSIGDL